MGSKTSPARRGRATLEESRTEILDAAAQLLWETSLADVTVGGLMARTRLGRSSFYVHFADLGELVAALLERLEAELWQAAGAWTEATDDGRGSLGQAVDGVVDVWTRHGPVLRAIVEAGLADENVAGLWRDGVVERFAQVIAEGIVDDRDNVSAGQTDPHELATALLLMNERYLMDRLGRSPQSDPIVVGATLRHIWTRTLYPGRD